MAITIVQFLQRLAESSLMSEVDARAFFEEFSQEDRPQTVEELARELVKRDKLTKYQAKLIYQGKTSRLVLGNYLILEKLGAGGMGQVFKAQHRRMKRIVALKTLPAHTSKDQAAVKRFLREVEAAARLDHPNVVTAYDADEDKGTHFLVMEHVEGRDLSALVKKIGTLSVGQSLDFILQSARGLEYAHSEGVIHATSNPRICSATRRGPSKFSTWVWPGSKTLPTRLR